MKPKLNNTINHNSSSLALPLICISVVCILNRCHIITFILAFNLHILHVVRHVQEKSCSLKLFTFGITVPPE